MAKVRKITQRRTPGTPAPPTPSVANDRLLGDIRALIEAAREQTARAVNSALVGLYWHIGKRIREDVLQEKRAEHGEGIVQALSAQLTAEYGRGYTEKGLRRMIQFAERFPSGEIVAALSRELSWSHFVELIPLEDTFPSGAPASGWLAPSITTRRKRVSLARRRCRRVENEGRRRKDSETTSVEPMIKPMAPQSIGDSTISARRRVS